MKAHVLIIEDEPEISELMELYLNREGLEVTRVTTGEAGLAVLEKRGADLLILDLNLPGMDGYEVLQSLRRDYSLPVIIVSARTDDAEMILGFGYGADDFVPKPFSPKVLAARVRAHLRRKVRDRGGASQNAGETLATPSPLITFGPYELDPEKRLLRLRGSRLRLSPREMDLLIFLARRRGDSFLPEVLLQEVWGTTVGDLATVGVHIQRLRKKLEEDASQPRYLINEYGFGYRLCGADEDPGSEDAGRDDPLSEGEE